MPCSLMLVVYENEYFFACDPQSLILFVPLLGILVPT